MRSTFVAAITVGLLYGACGGSLLSITVDDTTTTRVPAATGLEVLLDDMGFDELARMDLASAQEVQNQGVEPGDIEEVYLAEFELRATAPESADLSFIDRMELYVEAPDRPRRLVAWQDDFPEGERRVAFELEGIDLTDYAVSEAMTLSTDIEGRRPPDATDVEARYAIDLGVTARGACNQLRNE